MSQQFLNLNENTMKVPYFNVILMFSSIPNKNTTTFFGKKNGFIQHYQNNISEDLQYVDDYHFIVIRKATGEILLQDASTNGTWVNGEYIEKGAVRKLNGGDEIIVGDPFRDHKFIRIDFLSNN